MKVRSSAEPQKTRATSQASTTRAKDRRRHPPWRIRMEAFSRGSRTARKESSWPISIWTERRAFSQNDTARHEHRNAGKMPAEQPAGRHSIGNQSAPGSVLTKDDSRGESDDKNMSAPDRSRSDSTACAEQKGSRSLPSTGACRGGGRGGEARAGSDGQ